MCVFVGRSIHRIYESAIENNYLIKFQKNIVTEKESKHISDDSLVLICTGSQGEHNAALSKLIDENNKNIQLNKNDLIIFSSREIPGNEKINLLKEKILKKKCVYLDHRMMKVHVSGHPSKNELRKMYEWISPDSVNYCPW